MDPRKKKKVRQVLRLALSSAVVCVLLVGLGFQVNGSISKYIAGKTTWAAEVVAADRMRMPAISFCPGYRDLERRRRRHDGDSAYDIASLPTFFDGGDRTAATEEEITAWWSRVTFPARELFSHVKAPLSDANFLSEVDSVASDVYSYSGGFVTILPVPSTFGLCHTVTVERPIPHGNSLIVQLNMTSVGSSRAVSAYLHEPGDEAIGLNHNFWPRFVAHFDLKMDNFLDLPLEMEVRTSRNKGCSRCSDGDPGEYSSCILRWMRDAYLNANCSNVCWVPQSLHVTAPLGLPPCLSREETDCMLSHFYFGIVVFSDSASRTGCLRPCRERLYATNPRHNPKIVPDGSGVSGIFVYYRSGFYSAYEEYLLYDTNAIVAALGGSMGLFLGFSCLHAVNSMLNFALKRCEL